MTTITGAACPTPIPSPLASAVCSVIERGRTAWRLLSPRAWRARRLNAIFQTPERWRGLSDQQLLDLVHDQCIVYGRTENETRHELLRRLYRLAVARFDARTRAGLLHRTARTIESLHARHQVVTGFGWTKALGPFLLEDPESEIVETAAFEFATILPTGDTHALAGPAQIIAIALGNIDDPVRSPAMLAAVLALADRRVIALVHAVRHRLDAARRRRLLQSPKPFVAAAYVDLLMAWLEESALANDEDTFVHAAWALERMAQQAERDGIFEIDRRFPASDFGPEDPGRVVGRWTVAQYAERLLPRLIAVAQTRPSPSLAVVFNAWGLHGRTAERPARQLEEAKRSTGALVS